MANSVPWSDSSLFAYYVILSEKLGYDILGQLQYAFSYILETTNEKWNIKTCSQEKKKKTKKKTQL